MKKGLVSLLIVILLTNFIFFNSSYATTSDSDQTITQEEFEKMSEDGTADVNGSDYSIADIASSQNGTLIGFLVSFINMIPLTLQVMVSAFVSTGGVVGNEFDDSQFSFLYIRNIITGRFALLDANIFRDLTKDRDQGGAGLSSTDVVERLRTNIKMWFVIIRDIALVINLCMLLYIAIRMATVTIAQDKAKYKELLYNWGVSMVILFALPYMMSAINYLADLLTKFANYLIKNLEDGGQESFEISVTNQLIENLLGASGMQAALYTIIYWILVWNQLKFFSMYMKRALTSFFLIIIAPLITVTYSVDKIADRQAQAYNKWLHEYLLNMFIQPIHCFTYMVFMFMANDIAKAAPLVGIIFLLSMTKAEKIVISILGLSGITLKQVGDEFSMKNLTGKLKELVPKGAKPGAPK